MQTFCSLGNCIGKSDTEYHPTSDLRGVQLKAIRATVILKVWSLRPWCLHHLVLLRKDTLRATINRNQKLWGMAPQSVL